MDEFFGHPSSTLFFAAVSFCLFRWAPAGARNVDRISFYVMSVAFLFLAIAYLFIPLSGVLGVLAFVLLFIFYASAESTLIPGFKVSSEVAANWKKQRYIESSALIGIVLVIMFIWQKA